MINEKDLGQIVRDLNAKCGFDPSGKDAFIVDKQTNSKGSYRLEQVNGKTYGRRTTRENLYWEIDAMISGIKIARNLENEGRGL